MNHVIWWKNCDEGAVNVNVGMALRYSPPSATTHRCALRLSAFTPGCRSGSSAFSARYIVTNQ